MIPKLEQAAEQLQAPCPGPDLDEAKTLPSGPNELYSFWNFLADYADDKRDKKLFKKVIKAYDDTPPNGAQKNKAVKELKRRLDNMQRRRPASRARGHGRQRGQRRPFAAP